LICRLTELVSGETTDTARPLDEIEFSIPARAFPHKVPAI